MTGRNWRLLLLILFLSLLSAVARSEATAASVARERFGLRLASSLGLSQPRSNVAVSPLLLHSALTLLYAGVAPDEQTVQQQLRVALELQQLGTPEQALHMFEQLLAQLKQSAAVGCQLRLLSDFYTARSFMFDFRDEFLARAAKLGFGAHRLDFGNVASARQSINYEFLTRSNYSVGELVSSSLLEAAQDTPFLHVSALTFHAPWAQGFDPRETQRLHFFSDAQNHKLVESMFVEHSFRYAELPQLDACAVELPYATAGLSLLIIYPNQLEGLAQLERKLQSFDLQQLRSQLEERKLALTLPKFSLLAHTELRHILEQLGLGKLFTGEAQLHSVFSTFLSSSAPHLTAVPHTALLQLDEAGGEVGRTFVAAFSDLFRSTLSLVINHPFFFALGNAETLLLAGHVVDI